MLKRFPTGKMLPSLRDACWPPFFKDMNYNMIIYLILPPHPSLRKLFLLSDPPMNTLYLHFGDFGCRWISKEGHGPQELEF